MPQVDEIDDSQIGGLQLPDLTQEGAGGLVLPDLQPQNQYGEKSTRHHIPQVAAVKVVSQSDQGVEQNIISAENSVSIADEYDTQSDAALSQNISEITQGSRAVIAEDPNNVVPLLEATQELVNEEREAKTKGVGNEYQAASSLSIQPTEASSESIFQLLSRIQENGDITFQQRRAFNQAFRMGANNELVKLGEEIGVISKTTNFLSMIVPFINEGDFSDFVSASREAFGDEIPTPSFEYSNPGKSLSIFAEQFNSLPVARRVALFPEIIRIAQESTDTNADRAISILQRIINPKLTDIQGLRAGAVLSAVDALTLLPLVRVIKGISNLARSKGNILNVTQQVGGPAEDLVLRALAGGEQTAKAMGVSVEEAVASALPSSTATVLPGSLDNVSGQVRESYMNIIAKDDELFESIVSQKASLIEGTLTTAEKDVRKLTELERIKEDVTRDLLPDVYDLELNVIGETPTGFKVQVTKRNKMSDEEIIETEDVVYSLNDKTGTFGINDQNAAGQLNSFFGSGVSVFGSSQGAETVKTAVNIGQSVTGLRNILRDRLDTLNRIKIPAKDRTDANDVLNYYDDYVDEISGRMGKNPTVSELIDGVDVPGRGRLKLTTDAQLEYFINARSFGNTMRAVENFAIRKQWILEGKRDIAFNSASGSFVAKPFADLGAAKASLRSLSNSMAGRPITRFLDVAQNRMVTLADNEIDLLYDSGQQLVKVQDTTSFGRKGVAELEAGELVDFAIINRGSDRELPLRVLSSRDGYVPRVNTGVEFIIKKDIGGVRQGTRVVNEVAVRFTGSKRDAIRITLEENEKIAARNVLLEPGAQAEAEGVFRFIGDNELTDAERIGFGVGNGSSFATSSRSSRDIRFGLGSRTTDRLSITEAYERQVAYLARFVSMNDWRQGLKQTWVNNVKEALRLEGKPAPNFTYDQGLPANALNTSVGRALNGARDRIEFWTGQVTRTEQAWEGLMQRFHDFALNTVRGVPGLGLRNKESLDSILWLKHSNPFSGMKAASFHLLLGAWNPIQLFVQAQSMTVALARNPEFAGIAIQDAFRMSWTSNLKNPDTLKRLLREDPEFLEMQQGLQRSGMLDEVTQGNPDLNAFSKMSFGTLEKLKDNSLFLYRGGENANIRVSYSAAYRKWRKNNPGVKFNNDAQRLVQKDANLSRLELSKANAARFQGGINPTLLTQSTSVGLQFQQVMFKTFELMFRSEAKGGFNTAEKMKIAIGQFALYGAAGIPLGNLAVSQVAAMFNMRPSDISDDPEQQELLTALGNGGLIDSFILAATGARIDFANRSSVLGGTATWMRELILSNDSFLGTMTGPFGAIANKTTKAMSQIFPLVTAGIEQQSFTTEDLSVGAQVLADLPGTTRNLLKAWIMFKESRIRGSHGQTMIGPNDLPLGQFDSMEMLATAFGFRLSIENELRFTRDIDRTKQEVYRETVDLWMNLADKYRIARESGDEVLLAKTKSNMSAALKMVANTFDPLDGKKFRESLASKLFTDKSTMSRLTLKMIEQDMSGDVVATIPDLIDRTYGKGAMAQAAGLLDVSTRNAPAFIMMR